MSGHEGRGAAVRGAQQVAARVHRDISGPEPASYVTIGFYGAVKLMLCAHGGHPTSSFLLFSLLCDALHLPRGAYLDFPRTREWEAAIDRYCTLFVAHTIPP